MKAFLLITLLIAGYTQVGCHHTEVYGGDDPFALEGRPFYGDKPAYFDREQPGLGSRSDDR